MIFKKGMSLIVTIVNSGFSQKVVEASKKAGAEGATILSGRGNSRHETTSVLGVQIQPEKEMVMILVRKSFRKDIMKQIVRACDLSSEGKGLTFCLSVDEVAGVNHLFKNGVFRRDEIKPLKEEECDASKKIKPEEKGKSEEKSKPEEKVLDGVKVKTTQTKQLDDKQDLKTEVKQKVDDKPIKEEEKSKKSDKIEDEQKQKQDKPETKSLKAETKDEKSQTKSKITLKAKNEAKKQEKEVKKAKKIAKKVAKKAKTE